MIDFLRDLTKPAEEKRQEQMTAYVDGELSRRERQRFEQLMADDPGLQAEVAELRQFKQNLRQLPRRRVPRNFTLDPALYQAPQRRPLAQLYPAMRVATALTAVFLIIAVAADLLTLGGAGGAAFSAAPVAMESEAVEESAADAIAEAEAPAAAAEMVAEEAMTQDSTESANQGEEAPAEEAEAAPQMEVAAEPETAVTEIEEETATAPQEPLAAAPVLPVKPTPIVIGPETNTQTEEGAPLDDGASGATTEADLSQTAVAPTPSPAATKTPDTPRVQPTPTLDDRGVGPQPEATEITAAPVATIGVAQDDGTKSAVSLPQPQAPIPISTLRVIQIVLAVLLVVLGTAVWFTRRQL